jgi:vancomycin aglycone glucosyltransferase
MKIAIVIYGTRGDVQPMLALALGLMKNGHEILFCAPPEHGELLKRHGCPFVPFGPNLKEIFKANAPKNGSPAKQPSAKAMKMEITNQIGLLPEILKASDLLLGVGFVLGVPTAAEVLKIPYRFVIFYPAILGTSIHDPLPGRLLFGFGRWIMNAALKGFINKKRKEVGLNPIRDVWGNWMGEHVLVACDAALNPVREGVAFQCTQTGYMFLPPQTGLNPEVEQFISSGKPPVFIGFGSNPISRPEKLAHLFPKVAQITGQRLIISKGWADLEETLRSPDICYADDLPYEILFPKLAAIIHHGGTGTMASAARAGIPQAAFPYMADQFENRKQIVKLGLGPNACDFKKMSVKTLSDAINACTTNESYRKKSAEISQQLKSTNGLELTMQLIEQQMKQYL